MTFEEGGGGGIGDILKSDFEQKKVLQGNTCYTIASCVCQEKRFITRGLGEKKFLRKPMKSPYPDQSQMAGPYLHVENPATV